MNVSKETVLSLALLLSLSGCLQKKAKPVTQSKEKQSQHDQFSQVNMPLADDEMTAIASDDESVRSFFDDDMGEFVAVTQDGAEPEMKGDEAGNDFAWIETSPEQDKEFKVVYFDFDRYKVRPDQEEMVSFDVSQAEKLLADAKAQKGATFVFEGNSCHSAGSSVYNLALSEKRAKAVADYFVANGIARENIKIVGRGDEVPALKDGQPVTGGREEQWPNRRVEVHLIYT